MASRTATPSPAPTTGTPDKGFDFGTLTPVATDPIKTTRARESNPFTEHVKTSLDTKTTLAVTVPTAHAKHAVGMIRRAASAQGCGVSLAESNAGNGQTKVSFQGKAKRAYTPPTPEQKAATQAKRDAKKAAAKKAASRETRR